ncbi:MAG: twin-arginine translocase TatA/TatE family subunit, partial [Schwartzia sp.]|nr:twin-arginine translocase TatA/TatE family subunit [Schwartzia sp. (in: firmicutes)]
VGRAVGKSIREFKKATTAVTEEINAEPEKPRLEAKTRKTSAEKTDAEAK